MKCPRCDTENSQDSKFCKSCAVPLPGTGSQSPATELYQAPVLELETGSTFAGRYQVIEELGHGGMGRVYKVFDADVKEKIALKLLRPEIALDGETIGRFSNELKLARKISHRSVCRMFDLGKSGGTTFVTMEFVPGEDLKKFIRKTGPLGAGRTVSIAKQICEGLVEAHRLGIVHRDLKPQNIMVDEDGNVRIMDFGIARSLAEKGLTGAGLMIGTPEYMSPEQVEGKDVDPRSDIYSLGIVLFEMVTGQVPFEGDTPFTVGLKHKSEKPKSPKDYNAQIPEDLSLLILKCLEKERGRRYQSAAEVLAELGRIEKGIPTTERKIARKRGFTSREITVKLPLRKLLFPALGFVLLAVIALFAVRLLPRRPAAPPLSGKPSLAILYFENISGDKTLDAWKTGLTELLITKLGQSRFIRVLDGNTIYGLLKRLNLVESRKYAREDLQKIAVEGGAEYTLSGSLMKAGPNIIIALSLQKPRTGEVIRPISVECRSEEEIISKVDEVANTIKSDLDLSSEQIASDFDKGAGQITTTSPEAFKSYSEGRALHSRGDYRKSIELMQKAVGLDPEFAMAYRSMGSAYGNLGQTTECGKYYQKALEFKSRVSERERYSIEGDAYRQAEKTFPEAIEAYRKLLELYPDDLIGNTNLGVLYGNIEEWDQAIERYKVLLANGTGDIVAIGNLAEAYQALGRYDAAEKLLLRALLANRDNDSLLDRLAWTHAMQGRLDAALQEIRQAIALNPQNPYYPGEKAGIDFLKGDVPSAEREIEALLRSDDPVAKASAGEALVKLDIYQGRFAKAKEMLELGLAQAKRTEDGKSAATVLVGLAALNQFVSKDYEGALQQLAEADRLAIAAEDFNARRAILLVRGRVLIDRKSLVEAAQTAAELKILCEMAVAKRQIRLYLELQARIELETKNFAAAMDHIRRIQSLVPGPWDSDLLAEALDRSGAKKLALDEYRRLTASPTAKVNSIGTYVISFYKIGLISEGLGLKDEAIRSYENFLEIWKSADANAPFVPEAKIRLAGLKKS